MKIFKYPLTEFEKINLIEMPIGAKILCCHAQNNLATLWALVDEKQMEKQKRKFMIFQTGRPIEVTDPGEFIGTCFAGLLVFHVFELLESCK